MLLPKRRWMLWLQKSWQNKALWKNTQDPLPTARQGIFLLNHVEEFDILKSRSLWMEEYHVCKNKSRYQTLAAGVG